MCVFPGLNGVPDTCFARCKVTDGLPTRAGVPAQEALACQETMFAGGDECAAVSKTQQERRFVHVVDGFDDCCAEFASMAARNDRRHFVDRDEAISDHNLAKRHPTQVSSQDGGVGV